MTTEAAILANLNPVASDSGPISESSRVIGIDLARGVALLGIFFVNASLFGNSFGTSMQPHLPTDEGLGSVLFYWFTKIVCEGKFYPLFSILFGTGLAMMYQSAQATGRPFGWTFFRRLMVLALFGVAHIVLLWPGDILLFYATTGLWMLLLGRRKPKTLLITAGIVFAVGMLLLAGFLAVMVAIGPSPSAPTPEVRAMPEAESPLEQLRLIFQDWNSTEQIDSRFIQLEKDVMRGGPFVAAMVFRLVNYFWVIFIFAFAMFWVVLPCFCVGAALLKLGFLHGQHRDWRKRFILLGLVFALPLNAAAGIFTSLYSSMVLNLAAAIAINISGPLMSLMYLSLILNWADSGRAAGLAQALVNVGRMALTGYLLESILMCSMMAHWGFARFGLTTWAERGVYLMAIFGIIVLFCNVWIRLFRFGPFEWLWRTLTYMRWQPLLR